MGKKKSTFTNQNIHPAQVYLINVLHFQWPSRFIKLESEIAAAKLNILFGFLALVVIINNLRFKFYPSQTRSPPLSCCISLTLSTLLSRSLCLSLSLSPFLYPSFPISIPKSLCVCVYVLLL